MIKKIRDQRPRQCRGYWSVSVPDSPLLFADQQTCIASRSKKSKQIQVGKMKRKTCKRPVLCDFFLEPPFRKKPWKKGRCTEKAGKIKQKVFSPISCWWCITEHKPFPYGRREI